MKSRYKLIHTIKTHIRIHLILKMINCKALKKVNRQLNKTNRIQMVLISMVKFHLKIIRLKKLKFQILRTLKAINCQKKIEYYFKYFNI